MKRNIVILAIIILIAFTFLFGIIIPVKATDSGEYDFRETKWGMPREEVLNSEVKEPDAVYDIGFMYVNLPVAGLKSGLLYTFSKDDELVWAGYIFNNDYTNFWKDENNKAYIADYYDVKNTLTEIYGEPIKDDMIWKDDSHKDNPDKYLEALTVGDLEYDTFWETSSTRIQLFLNGQSGYLNSFLLTYLSLELEDKFQGGWEYKPKSSNKDGL